MIWTYRVFRDREGRYSVREVFHEQDGRIIDYGKAPVVVVGASLEEVMQLVMWFKEAFDLPVLALEEVDAHISSHPARVKSDYERNISLQDVIAELSTQSESSNRV